MPEDREMGDNDPMADEELIQLLDELEKHTDAANDTVDRARESLEQTLAALELTPDEQQVLHQELSDLRDLTQKLDDTTIEIAAFGMVSRGKSSVLNALVGEEVFKVGATHGTTVVRASQRWQHSTLDRPGLEGARLVVVDTPGIDEVGGEVREALARGVARHSDLILFVVSGDMQRSEVEALSELREAQKPIILVFNQIDRYPDVDRAQIYEKIKDDRVKNLVRPEDIVMTAARPEAFKVKIQLPDGTSKTQWEHPAPLIEPLKLRILDVLDREGKALVALNTLLMAGDLHAEIVSRKVQIRDSAANRMIWNFAIAKGAAVALNPIPVADLAGGLAVDVGMIVALSKVYGIPLTRKTAGKLVRDMMLALGAMGAVALTTKLVASGIKSSLAGLTIMTGGLATPLTMLGYGAIGMAQAGTGATTSYVIGQGAKTYLRQGCQWGPRGIKTVIQQIVVEAKTDSVIDRLKDDLKKRLEA